jgi:hypothetical protein
MARSRILHRAATAGAATLGLLFLLATGAQGASTVTLCISSKPGAAVKSGECPASTKAVKYTPVALPAAPAEQQKLLSILPYIKYVSSGVGGKPTIQVSGANVQILSGVGFEDVNGAGNLIVGSDAEPGTQTGSENLVLGRRQTYTSFGAVIGGEENTVGALGRWGVVFGSGNLVNGYGASVTGGAGNEASGEDSSVSGGGNSFASSLDASVSGGDDNGAAESWASVTGGDGNRAWGGFSSVSGGQQNRAYGASASIDGGWENETRAGSFGASVSGGRKNLAEADFSSILGGKEIALDTEYGVSP